MPKVMLVEDDATMLSLLGTLLEMEGFEVIQQSEDSLGGILGSLSELRPELILLDVHLRQFNGMDLLKKMRLEPGLSGIKVLMSSGMDFRRECLEAGADDFILKPYMPDVLIAHIHHLLEEVR